MIPPKIIENTIITKFEKLSALIKIHTTMNITREESKGVKNSNAGILTSPPSLIIARMEMMSAKKIFESGRAKILTEGRADIKMTISTFIIPPIKVITKEYV